MQRAKLKPKNHPNYCTLVLCSTSSGTETERHDLKTISEPHLFAEMLLEARMESKTDRIVWSMTRDHARIQTWEGKWAGFYALLLTEQ